MQGKLLSLENVLRNILERSNNFFPKYPHAFFLSRCRFPSGSFEALWLPAHFVAVAHGDFAAPVQRALVVFE